MNATGKALDWLREDVLGSRRADRATLLDEAPARLARAPTVSSSCPTWPASARRSGTRGARGVRRADPPPRPGAPRPGGPRGGRTWPSVTSPRRSSPPVSRSASCGSPVGSPASPAWNRVKADVTGFTVAVPEVVETAMRGLGDRRPRRGRRVRRTSPTGRGRSSGSTTGSSPIPRRRAVYDAALRGLRRALPGAPADLPSGSPRSTPRLDPRPRSTTSADDDDRPARRRPARRSAELVAARGARGGPGSAGRAARRRHERRYRDRRRRLHRPVDRVLHHRARPVARGSCSSSRRSAAAARAVATAAS